MKILMRGNKFFAGFIHRHPGRESVGQEATWSARKAFVLQDHELAHVKYDLVKIECQVIDFPTKKALKEAIALD